jgi:hypothetical protein
MTRAQIRVHLLQLAPENQRATSTTGAGSSLETLINDKQMVVAQDTECLRKSISQALTADTQEYTQTSVIVRLESVIFYDVSADTKMPLDIKTERSLDDKYPGWRTADSGTPIAAYARNNVIGTYPTADTTNDYLYLESVVLPDSLSSDNQELWTLSGSATYQVPSLDWMVIYLCAENIKRERGFNEKADVFRNPKTRTGLYYEEFAKIATSVYIKEDAKRDDRLNFYSYAKKYKL